jgi:UDP-glucose 4-epimerase
LPITEEQQPVPEDPYGIAKLAVEQELRVTKEMFGMDYIIFRPHNVYGERQNIGDRYRNVIGIFMNQILQDLPMTLFGDGTQTRAFTHISEVAPVIAESIENSAARNQIFNVGADMPYSVRYLAEAVAGAMGVAPRINHLPPRNEVKNAYCSHEKLEKIFGRREGVSLVDGLSGMADWTRSHGARKSKKFENIEILTKLPDIWLKD